MTSPIKTLAEELRKQLQLDSNALAEKQRLMQQKTLRDSMRFIYNEADQVTKPQMPSLNLQKKKAQEKNPELPDWYFKEPSSDDMYRSSLPGMQGFSEPEPLDAEKKMLRAYRERMERMKMLDIKK